MIRGSRLSGTYCCSLLLNWYSEKVGWGVPIDPASGADGNWLIWGSLYEKYRRDGARGDRKIAELIKANHTQTFTRTTAEAIRKVLPAARFQWQEALDLHGYDDVDFDAPGDPLPDGWEGYVDLN